MSVDSSRCITCFNCIEKCKAGAIKYTPLKISTGKENKNKVESIVENEETNSVSRQNFLTITGLFLLANTVKAQQLHVDGGLAEIQDKKIPDRKVPIVPPGAEGGKEL